MKNVAFSEIFSFQKKSKIKAGDNIKDGTFPFYTSSNELTKRIDFPLFDKPSLIFGTGGQASVHYCDEKFSVSTDCFVTQLKNTETTNLKFIYYYLSGHIRILEEGFKGAGLKHISKEYISQIPIPLPPLKTQKKIAAILDKADELRQNDKKILEKYDQLAQSVFLEMFGDPVRNPKGWDIKTINELVVKNKWAIKRGPFGGSLKKEIFVEKGYLVYEQYHALNNDFTFERYYIDENKFQELKAFEVKPNDIIISCSGVYLGKLAIIPKNAKKGIINQALLKITLDEKKMRNDFFIYHFTQKHFKETFFDSNRGAGIPNFPPMSDFKKFPFITPSIDLQNLFHERIKKIEQQKYLTKQSLQKSEELFQSLLQQAFRGELAKYDIEKEQLSEAAEKDKLYNKK